MFCCSIGCANNRFDLRLIVSGGNTIGHWSIIGLGARRASSTWHDVSTRRTVAFAGFGDRLTGDHNAGTAQACGEAGYCFARTRIALELLAGEAYVNLQTDGFGEGDLRGCRAQNGLAGDTGVANLVVSEHC